MGAGSSVAVLRDIQTLFDSGTAGGLTDRQLLDRFVSSRDTTAEAAAFQVLVLRHGPMVLRVCHNLLRDPNDAHDAFQATFLVLVRRSKSIRKLDSVGGWLYGVACRVAARAKVDAARRRSAEERVALQAVEAVDPTGVDEMDSARVGTIVQEEVRRLPEKYRAVVALCYWQGLTHEQAAVQLGCPLGTVRSRVARARNLLRRRLIRRGFAFLAGVVTAPLDQPSATASGIAAQLAPVPPELVQSTIQAAVRIAAGESTAKVVSGVASSLVRQSLWSMTMIQVKMSLGGAILVGLMRTGAWFGGRVGPRAGAQLTSIQKPVSPNKKVEAAAFEKTYCLVPGQNVVVAVVPDGTVVKKGDVVCELDSAALADQLLIQKITLLSALSNYETAKLDRENAELAVVEYEQGVFSLQREETEGNIKIAEAELAFAHYALIASKANSVAVPLEIKRAEMAELRARFALEKAQSRKKVLLDFTHGKKIKEVRSAVGKCRSVELAKQAILELETGKEKKLERAVSACRVVAPRDGTVRKLFKGMTVSERQPIFEIIPTPDAKAGPR